MLGQRRVALGAGEDGIRSPGSEIAHQRAIAHHHQFQIGFDATHRVEGLK